MLELSRVNRRASAVVAVGHDSRRPPPLPIVMPMGNNVIILLLFIVIDKVIKKTARPPALTSMCLLASIRGRPDTIYTGFVPARMSLYRARTRTFYIYDAQKYDKKTHIDTVLFSSRPSNGRRRTWNTATRRIFSRNTRGARVYSVCIAVWPPPRRPADQTQRATAECRRAPCRPLFTFRFRRYFPSAHRMPVDQAVQNIQTKTIKPTR